MTIREGKMRTLAWSVLIIAALSLSSCHKIMQLSVIPHIEFTSFQVFDTTDLLGNECKGGRLKFYFEDGDGNVGMYSIEGDTVTKTTNLFFTIFRKTNTTYNEVTDSLMKASDYTIPYMERTGRNKILKGTIAVTFLYTFYSVPDSDIFRYRFFIKDRAENMSDTVWTCDIPLSVNNLYKN